LNIKTLEMNSKIFSKVKSDFTLPDKTYLNSASQTLIPNQVKNSYLDICNKIDARKEYENVRQKVKLLINSKKDNEVVFTQGNNHSINMIAKSICHKWHSNDCVIVPESEHHANLLIWQYMSIEYGFRFETVNVIKDGSMDLGHLEDLLDSCDGKILFSMSHISNSIGYVQPVKSIFDKVKEYDGITLLDASLSIGRELIDVQEFNIDFLTFTGHKFYGPTGVGILYGKQKYLDKLEPTILGDSNSTLLPWKLEIGKPNIASVVMLGSAIDWFTSYDLESFHTYDKLMNANFQMMLNELDFVEIFHPGYYKGGLIGFNLHGHHPAYVGEFLSNEGIVLKYGHLNARPIVEEKFPNGILRLSWACYNTKEDVEQLRQGLIKFYDKYSSKRT